MFKLRKLVPWKALILGLPLSFAASAFAATPIDLENQNVSILNAFVKDKMNLKELRQNVDFNHTTHIHFSQTYRGYAVYGGEGVMHVRGSKAKITLPAALSAPQAATTLSGKIYKNLDTDLASAPPAIFTKDQAQKALKSTIKSYQNESAENAAAIDPASELMVYVDDQDKAHWAYKVTFYVEESEGKAPALPVYIVDAQSFKIYQQWNEVKNVDQQSQVTLSGGIGGNIKMGEIFYDGLEGHLPALTVTRDAQTQICNMKNDDVTVLKYDAQRGDSEASAPYTFDCSIIDPDHNNVYWTDKMGEVNGGYSPGNDALFGGIIIKQLYKQWYNQEVLSDKDGKPLMLHMVVHKKKYDNAYWNPRTSSMVFGDGKKYFYPLTSLGVSAHEVSHGFTQQHAGLAYFGQSGGINEAFSDMAAQAAEYFAYGPGKNSWQIGPEILKEENDALRFMDQPSKDCHGQEPGEDCSIDDASQYIPGMNVHYSSGVYNRLFYLIASSQGWDVKKAFDVMVKANMDYWTPSSNFKTAACGIISATKDYGYDMPTLLEAFKTVKVDVSKCKIDDDQQQVKH